RRLTTLTPRIMLAPRVAVPALLVAVSAAIAPPAASAQSRTAGGAPLDVAGLEVAAFEDYRTPAGERVGDALHVALEARPAAWYPWGENRQGLRGHVFAVPGMKARVPGPMIRVGAGTPVRVSIHNTFGDTLVVFGLADRIPRGGAPPAGPPLIVPPGATVDTEFTPTVPGSYFDFGRVLEDGWGAGPPPGLPDDGLDRSLAGVYVVDPPGLEPPPEERVFLITHWADPRLEGSWLPATRFMINGRSWPATERLAYTQGDTVRWRVINLTGREHPMHLHGFFFRVDARGDGSGEVVYGASERRMAVTETLFPTESMRISWVPTEPGNWIFHCHFMRHMSWIQALDPEDATSDAHAGDRSGEDLMAGLVLGITVDPRPGAVATSDVPRRRLELHIGRHPGVFGDDAGYGFVLQDGERAPAPDSVRFPGSPIVLARGEPTEIEVHNHADVPLGVHWHGLELESWADGVPGWSGSPDAVRGAVAPGSSFTVRMTPPRAGTFMYHAHSEPGHQLAQGLYGPFLVLEPGETWDRETDRLFLLGSLGAGTDAPPAINGRHDLGPLEFEAGVAHRLRFMHISPDDDKRVWLLEGEAPVTWRHVAKDGADLPSSLIQETPAELRIHVGETYDFTWTPEPGTYTLRVLTTFDRGVAAFPREAPDPVTQEVVIRVRPNGDAGRP
ncbi:MAG: multicopper oxidase domain-containing protein, partial [Longimicrobiales bacterium]